MRIGKTKEEEAKEEKKGPINRPTARAEIRTFVVANGPGFFHGEMSMGHDC